MLISRRRFLIAASQLAALSMSLPRREALAQHSLGDYPFSLGVASGYPATTSVVLWTRILPAVAGDSSRAGAAIDVVWEVASDERFRNIVRSGKERAVPALAHSVHVEVQGLEPGRRYFYRFHTRGAVSPTGHTRTVPAPNSAELLRFAVASCQHYEHGYFVAYGHMAGEDLDLIVHTGDYIYDTSRSTNYVRKHNTGEPVTLDDFRDRYVQYKSDPDLQAAHAAAPWIATWDDHEVHRDYANDRSEDLQPRDQFLARRAAAYQAYYEHMPLPPRMQPRGPDMKIYGKLEYGRLATFYVLDTRQYRSYHACPRPGRGGGNVVSAARCDERLDSHRSMLGLTQERWLHDELAASTASWNIVAQQTLIAQLDRTPGPEQSFWTDGWDGYPRARERLLTAIAERRVRNPVVVGGDMHMFIVADLKKNFDDADSQVIATEFVCGAITSPGRAQSTLDMLRKENPHIRYANATRRGYTTFEIRPNRCLARMRGVATVAARESPIHDLVAYVVEHGHPGAQRF